MMEEQNNSLIKVNSGLLAALSNGSGLNIAILPKDILVLETVVAGTSFCNLADVEPQLSAQVKLDLRREPDNQYDEFAIALYFEKNKIGYIPKESNEVIARLLDAGKPFFAVIEAKEWEGNWLRIKIKVYLRD